MTAPPAWRASTQRLRGFAQLWADVRGDQLLAVMVDWDRPVAPALAELLASTARGAAGQGAARFPQRLIGALYDRLVSAEAAREIGGVSVAAVATNAQDTAVAWVGDVRAQVESAGEVWSSTDHTVGNLAAREGVLLDDLERELAKRTVAKVVGRLGALKIEEQTIASSPIRRLALCTADVHGYRELDIPSWTLEARPGTFPVDDLFEAALFEPAR
jgi:hypothetical protein